MTTYLDLETGTSVLAKIDPESGSVSVVGDTGVALLQGLTYHNKARTLFGIRDLPAGEDELYIIDPQTAESELVGILGVRGVNSLAYDSTRDQLFASGGKGDDGGVLFSIDAQTGFATPVGTSAESRASSLTYYPPGDQLLFRSSSGPFGAYDPDTGEQMLLGSSSDPVFGMSWDQERSLLFAVPGFVPGGSGEGNTLFTVDPATGATSPFSTLSQVEFYSSLAYIPTPSGAIVLLASLGAVGVRRR